MRANAVDDKKEEARLLVATFIVASLIAFIQVDMERLDDWFGLVLGLLFLPLVISAIFAFLFVIGKGAELLYIDISAGTKKWVSGFKTLMYNLAIAIYILALLAFIFAVAAIRIFPQLI